MSPKILVNATTLTIGGGVQVGVSFVEHACLPKYRDHAFVFAVTQPIYDNLRPELQNDSRVKVFPVSPARIFRGHHSRVVLKRIENEFWPDIVYTLGLPSYIRFRTPEVGRYTNPWEINPPPLPWGMLPLAERLKLSLVTRYRLWWARRAVFFETQTQAAKKGIVQRLGVPDSRVLVVPNSPNPLFLAADNPGTTPPSARDVTVFCLAAAHRHKNLTFIPEVATVLKDLCPERHFSFIVTIPRENRISAEILRKSRQLAVDGMVKNVGPLTLAECVEYYRRSQIVFLPTLLEVFSATYLEAMAMARPIVTSDLECTRAVCGEAALYYDADSAAGAAEAIAALVRDSAMRDDLVERGRKQLARFPTPDEKHAMVLAWLSEVVESLRTTPGKQHT